MAADHGKEDHPSTPQVSLLPVVLEAFDQFGGRIAWGAASRGQLLALLVSVREAEVDHLEIRLVVEQQVLWLHISVDDS